MRKILSVFMSMALLMTVIGCGNAANPPATDGGEAEDKPTITLGEAPYEHIWFINSVIKNIAEERGYPVEITEGDVGVVYVGVSQKEIDVYADVWYPTLHGPYVEKYENEIDVIGTLYEKALLAWAVPSYVEYDSIEELKGNESEFDNRVVGIEPSAGIMLSSEEIIEGYDLDFELLGGSTVGMLSELKRSISKEEPMIFLAWRPHIMFQQFDVKALDDPQGYFNLDDVKVGVAKGFDEKAPDLYQLLDNMEISMDELENAMVKMEEGEDRDELAAEWVETNRDKIDQWLGQ